MYKSWSSINLSSVASRLAALAILQNHLYGSLDLPRVLAEDERVKAFRVRMS